MSIPVSIDPLGTLGSLSPFVCPVMTSQTTWRTTPPPSCGVVGFSASPSHSYLPKPSEWKSLSGLYFAENQDMPENDTYVCNGLNFFFWEVEFDKRVVFSGCELAFCIAHGKPKNTGTAKIFVDGILVATEAFTGTIAVAHVVYFNLLRTRGKKFRVECETALSNYTHFNVNSINGEI